MIIHTFICDNCGYSVEDTNTKGIHVCPKCNSEMRWDIGGNQCSNGDYRHVSDSLAMHPDQIPEHNARFPNIKVHPDGRPEFNSVRQQSNYLKAIGFVKHPQKIKHKGERIA